MLLQNPLYSTLLYITSNNSTNAFDEARANAEASGLSKFTEMEAIINLADSNKNRTYGIADRISGYLDRQVGLLPSQDEGSSYEEMKGNIFSINTILKREAQCITYIEKMLSYLEEIG